VLRSIDVHAANPEMGRGDDQALVVGVNLRQGVLRRACRVERIGGAEEDVLGQRSVGVYRAILDRRAQGQPAVG